MSFSTHAVRLAVLAAAAITLAGLTGCSTGINTMSAPTTPTRMTRFSGYPIDDPSPSAPGMPPAIARGYGQFAG